MNAQKMLILSHKKKMRPESAKEKQKKKQIYEWKLLIWISICLILLTELQSWDEKLQQKKINKFIIYFVVIGFVIYHAYILLLI